MQALQYFEHLSEPMADFLAILVREFDHTQLTEDVLRQASTALASDLKPLTCVCVLAIEGRFRQGGSLPLTPRDPVPSPSSFSGLRPTRPTWCLNRSACSSSTWRAM